jgi:hypothetical protein
LKEQTFIGQRHFLWLWLVLALLLALAGVYLYDQPIGGRNGGTRLGLAYGGMAAAAVAFLMWYGVRKRYSYKRARGTLRGWLGPHVWIGSGLALLVPMHCGFHIGWNVHAAPYFLMLLTIASGIWGAIAYVRMPPEMESRREGLTVRKLAEQIEDQVREIGILARNRSEAFGQAVTVMTVPLQPSLTQLVLARPFKLLKRDALSDLLATLPREEYQAGVDLAGLAARRIHLANQMLAEASVVAQMRIWLYLHLPLSFACVVAIGAHVAWALLYRGAGR